MQAQEENELIRQKANSPGVRGLQARQGDNDMQAQYRLMPQREGAEVAKTARENK